MAEILHSSTYNSLTFEFVQIRAVKYVHKKAGSFHFVNSSRKWMFSFFFNGGYINCVFFIFCDILNSLLNYWSLILVDNCEGYQVYSSLEFKQK